MGIVNRIIGVLLVSTLSLSACMSTHYLAPPEKSEFLTRRAIYVVLDDGAELRLSRCVLNEDLLIGFARNNQRVEVELSRIRVAYFKKLKPGMTTLGACSVGAAVIAIWLIVGASSAPRDAR